jgi:hypothetical protein
VATPRAWEAFFFEDATDIDPVRAVHIEPDLVAVRLVIGGDLHQGEVRNLRVDVNEADVHANNTSPFAGKGKKVRSGCSDASYAAQA